VEKAKDEISEALITDTGRLYISVREVV